MIGFRAFQFKPSSFSPGCFSAKQKNGEFQWMEACRPRTHGIYPWALEICHLHLDVSCIKKGFCFITFESEQVVSDLLKRPKQIIKDKEVDVKKATPKPEQFMMGRGRGSRGGRGRGGRSGYSQGWNQGGYGNYGNYGQGGYGYDGDGGGYDGYGGYDYSSGYGNYGKYSNIRRGYVKGQSTQTNSQ
ncbi:uncharacterized protein LOC143206590 [Rhynchophorus ferrugineus]|uniref:uncharacterized protein LOC143206590 n=1 Tax=Rhynchophorus ferrugineus TaxID=354439 RepID=UPI003FCEB345